MDTEKTDLPFWHRKKQKAYRINRIIIFLQIAASLALSCIILFGIEKVTN